MHEYTYDISYIIIDFIPLVNSFFVKIDNVVFVRNDESTGCLTEFFLKYLWQYRTKSVWRLCTPSACKFSVILHKNAREYIKYSLRFLFHLTKNLTTHLPHNLCAVLPCVSGNLATK